MASTDIPATRGHTAASAGASPAQSRVTLPFGVRNFANWSVRTKLIAILVLPVAAACAVGVVRVDDLLDTASTYGSDVEVSRAQRATAELVRQVGVEQVAATAAVTGATVEPGMLLPVDDQRTETDAVAERATALVAALEDPPVELRRSTAGLQNALDGLDDLRANTDPASGTAGLSPAQVIRAYDAVTGSALRLGDTLAGAIGDDDIQALAVSSQSLIATNRQGAREDSFVLAAAAAGPDVLDPAEVRAIVTDRATAFTDFQAAGTAQQQAAYAQAFASDVGEQRTALFTDVLRALTGKETPTLTTANWVATAAPAAARLAAVQQQISDEQVATAESLRDETRNRALREAILLLVLLLLGFGITFLAVRSVLRPLRVLQADAMDIAQRMLPEEIQQIRDGRAAPDQAVRPVGVATVEEIGQVARAFDAVHQEALRLAGEQEQLRRNVNEIFVNLSRRSQGLVERQLALIDRLEGEEQDPEQLAQLFRLDHLAARMRRNNDNLMVLAGAEGSRSVSRPMAVVDVVRAAVSETDQYERVTINPTPSVTVAAVAAKDLVHLLAELLDNATVFSSPSSTVTVAVSGTYQEGLVIEVYDRGLGIPGAELDGLNRKLAEPPVVDAQVPRQMGLFVVARLAGRHEMQVELRASAAGAGTVAAVWVPPTVLSSELDQDRTAPVGARAPQVMSQLGDPPKASSPLTPQQDARQSTPPVVRPRIVTPTVSPPSSVPSPMTTPLPLGLTRAPAMSEVPIPTAGTATHAAAAAHNDRDSHAEDDIPPIFAELSAWFSADAPHRDSVPAAAAATTGVGVSGVTRWVPGSPITVATVSEIPRAGPATGATVPAAAPAAAVAAVSQRSFDSPADAGWRAAQAVTVAGSGITTTSAGLPKRRPRAYLVPGSANPTGPDRPAEPTAQPRNADAVRGRLSSYQRGLQSGRKRTAGTDTAQSTDTPPGNGSDSGQRDALGADVRPEEQDRSSRHEHSRDDERRYAQ